MLTDSLVQELLCELERSRLLSRAEQGDILAVVVASYQDERGAKWLGEKANLPVLMLPMSVGGNDSSQDLFSLYDSAISLLNGVK